MAEKHDIMIHILFLIFVGILSVWCRYCRYVYVFFYRKKLLPAHVRSSTIPTDTEKINFKYLHLYKVQYAYKIHAHILMFLLLEHTAGIERMWYLCACAWLSHCRSSLPSRPCSAGAWTAITTTAPKHLLLGPASGGLPSRLFRAYAHPIYSAHQVPLRVKDPILSTACVHAASVCMCLYSRR